jgi:aspartyl protease family protein
LSGNGDDALSFLYLLGCLVLVASAFMVRRIPLGQGLKMAAAWLLIFLAMFIAFTLKDDFAALAGRVLGETRNEGQSTGSEGEVRIRKSLDGHFWATVRVNGTPTRFLIDSGATVTSLSAQTAREANIEPGGGLPVAVNTANGVVTAARGRAERLELESIERRDMGVLISEAFGTTDVLGMNFLSSLSSWSVEGDWLILRP